MDIETVGLFLATWAMIIPIYYQLGKLKQHLGCPVCKKAIAEKDLKEADIELQPLKKRILEIL